MLILVYITNNPFITLVLILGGTPLFAPQPPNISDVGKRVFSSIRVSCACVTASHVTFRIRNEEYTFFMMPTKLPQLFKRSKGPDGVFFWRKCHKRGKNHEIGQIKALGDCFSFRFSMEWAYRTTSSSSRECKGMSPYRFVCLESMRTPVYRGRTTQQRKRTVDN